ncbi:hypothetical protein GCM10027418_09720 [Mariniluteicoccus endophyticus]
MWNRARIALIALALLTAVGGPRSDRPQVMAPLRHPPALHEPFPEDESPRSDDALDDKPTLRSTIVGGKLVQYCGNGSIDRPPATVRRVIFMIHGNDRGSCNAAGAVMKAGTADELRTTMVVAPRFPMATDSGVDHRNQLHWSFYGWSQGDVSLNTDAPISSFAVLDNLASRVPRTSRVMAGFSGGGQFINRYAAGTPVEATRFVIANPSSYLYFTSKRPGVDPKLLLTCPHYDRYRYGMSERNTYMRQWTPEELQRRYASRDVVYLLGDADNDPKSSSMDIECGAQSQGSNRYERGRNYWAYLPSVFGARITERQSMFVVRGVAHDGGRMMADPNGKKALFR